MTRCTLYELIRFAETDADADAAVVTSADADELFAGLIAQLAAGQVLSAGEMLVTLQACGRSLEEFGRALKSARGMNTTAPQGE